MQYISAYILCAIGNEQVEQSKVNEILAAAGATIDETKLSEIFDSLKGKNIWEVIEQGKKQMGSMAVAAAPAAAAGSSASKEEVVEEKKEEEEEEEEDFGGFGDLF
ncbi:60S acidic ribosomal protein P2 [Entamoeba marina]